MFYGGTQTIEVMAAQSTTGFERLEILSAEAKDYRDFIDPQIVCDSCSTAQRYFLSTTIKNNGPEPSQVVTIIEVRDHDGITQFLQFGVTIIEANATSNTGVSWDPKISGQFELRTFVISDFEHGQVLSSVHTASVIVS
jgi:hypothetical protein